MAKALQNEPCKGQIPKHIGKPYRHCEPATIRDQQTELDEVADTQTLKIPGLQTQRGVDVCKLYNQSSTGKKTHLTILELQTRLEKLHGEVTLITRA